LHNPLSDCSRDLPTHFSGKYGRSYAIELGKLGYKKTSFPLGYPLLFSFSPFSRKPICPMQRPRQQGIKGSLTLTNNQQDKSSQFNNSHEPESANAPMNQLRSRSFFNQAFR
jgi:hypothetical protein